VKASRTVKIWGSVCHHLGAKAANVRLLEQHVKDGVREKWNGILLGDLINNGVSAGSKHVGLEFEDVTIPMDQVEQVTDIFMPMAKAKLWRRIVGGNHAYRTYKAAGMHPEKVVAMLLSIAQGGEKPTAVLPSILQRVHELAYLVGGGGNPFKAISETREQLHRDISKLRDNAGEQWAIPFSPGLASCEVEGVPCAMHHGCCGKSKDNWKRLWNSIPGHRLYFTGHNHEPGWVPKAARIVGKKHKADFYSCGTYQGYEDYAAIAAYEESRVGSILVIYNKDTNRAQHEFLE
jgi:hypothetical protein